MVRAVARGARKRKDIRVATAHAEEVTNQIATITAGCSKFGYTIRVPRAIAAPAAAVTMTTILWKRRAAHEDEVV